MASTYFLEFKDKRGDRHRVEVEYDPGGVFGDEKFEVKVAGGAFTRSEHLGRAQGEDTVMMLIRFHYGEIRDIRVKE